MADQNLNNDQHKADPSAFGENPQAGKGAPTHPDANGTQPTTPLPHMPEQANSPDQQANGDDFLTTRFDLDNNDSSDHSSTGADQSSPNTEQASNTGTPSDTGESSSSDNAGQGQHDQPSGTSGTTNGESGSPSSGYTPAPGYGANPGSSYGEYGQPSTSSSGSGYPYGASAGNNTNASGSQGNESQNGNGYYGPNGYGPNNYGQNTNGYGQNPSGYGYGYGYGTPGSGNGGWTGNGWNNQGYGPANSKPAPRKKMSQTARTWWAAIVAALVAALLVLGIGWGGIASGLITIPTSTSLNSLNSSGSGSGSAKVPTGKTVDWQALNRRVASSVVSIQAQLSNGVAAGSGAILDTRGDIVTNNHVVEGSSQLQVTLNNGNIYAATIVGQDSTTDLAVIRLKNGPSNLTPVTFADSSTLAVGEQIMSIGNPLGYENTATTGIISALNRPVSVSDESTNAEIVTNAVQIDAAINPGNSGGPTFNAAGQVIGINSSIATASNSSSSSSSSGSIGIGFAIPSNLVKRVSTAIIKDGHIDHAQLGITIRNGSAEADGATRAGAEVVSVNAGSAGSKAGLTKGDVIVGFNGNTVSGMYSLLGYVRAAAVGETVKLTVIRGGRAVDVSCKLTEVESRTSSGTNRNRGNSNGNNGNNGQGNGNSNRNKGNGNNNNDNGGDDGFDFGGLSDPFGWF